MHDHRQVVCSLGISSPWEEQSHPCPKDPQMSKHCKIQKVKNMINMDTIERFYSETIVILLSIQTKWKHFLLSVCIWILVGQWKVMLSWIFIWKVDFIYLQFVFHIASNRKRIPKWTWKGRWNLNSSLLLESLDGIGMFSIVHETNRYLSLLFLWKRDSRVLQSSSLF